MIGFESNNKKGPRVVDSFGFQFLMGSCHKTRHEFGPGQSNVIINLVLRPIIISQMLIN